MRINTSLSGVSLEVKGKRICFTIMDKNGKNQNYWLTMPDRMSKALNSSIQSELDYAAMLANMTQAQKQEYYAESIG